MDIEIMKHMGFSPSPHNEIFFEHLEIITDFLKQRCPIEKKKCMSMLHGCMGISNRYVKEHLDSLCAWDIIRSRGGNYEWILGIKIENMLNEDVPDNFPGCLGMVLDVTPRKNNIVEETYPICKSRQEDTTCIFFEGKPFKPSPHRCNACKTRQEV